MLPQRQFYIRDRFYDERGMDFIDLSAFKSELAPSEAKKSIKEIKNSPFHTRSGNES